MSEGFKGFSDSYEGKDLVLNIRRSEVQKIIKDYKKIKKYMKSSLFEVERLSGKETKVDKLLNEYGIDSEAIE
jgi:hypothetical protein